MAQIVSPGGAPTASKYGPPCCDATDVMCELIGEKSVAGPRFAS